MALNPQVTAVNTRLCVRSKIEIVSLEAWSGVSVNELQLQLNVPSSDSTAGDKSRLD